MAKDEDVTDAEKEVDEVDEEPWPPPRWIPGRLPPGARRIRGGPGLASTGND